MSKARTRAASFAGTATDGYVLTSDAVGVGYWEVNTVAPIITSFQYSDGASATAEKTVVGLITIACGTTISTTVTVAGDTLGIQIGMVVAGVGIPVGATVVSVDENVSFVLSSAATIVDSDVDLTFGGAVLITGTGYDSVLGGDTANIAVTFGGTSATSISVNSFGTIITCTPPAHAAGTVTLQITNASALTASTNFIYDIEPVFTTAAGSLGGFVEATTFTDGAGSATPGPVIAGTESGVALTTGFQRVTSATDDTVITTALQGLTLQTSGYLTGTLTAGANATTYPFYATAKDNENQRTAPRLFNIISYNYPLRGEDIRVDPGAYTGGGYRSHTFTSSGYLYVLQAVTADILLVGGGGAGGASENSDSGGAGGGGAGAVKTSASYSLGIGTYTVTIGEGGIGQAVNYTYWKPGGDSNITLDGSSILLAGGGGGGGNWSGTNSNTAGEPGADGSSGGGGNGYSSQSGGAGDGDGGTGGAGGSYGGGGGGDNGDGDGGGSAGGGDGGTGTTNVYRLGSDVTYASGGGGGAYGGSSGGAAGYAAHGGAGGATRVTGNAAADNTGAGGGAGGGGPNTTTGQTTGGGGSGGKGIAVIRYAAT